MPLPEIQLDDRSFEDIVRDARRRIPTYTPEWTDYNESDPGVTLLQLFAWLSEMILYRLNQVPDKNYLKFLDLVGIAPNPPQPAKAELTFSLTSKDLNTSVLIPKGTIVALASPVDGGPVEFETDDDLNAVGAALAAVQSFDGGLFKLISDADHPAGGSFYPFGPRPQPQAALYLGFDKVFPPGSIRFRVHVDTSGLIEEGQGLAAGDTAQPAPPVVAYWEYWAGDKAKWRRLGVTSDLTGAFTRTGDVTFDRTVGLGRQQGRPQAARHRSGALLAALPHRQRAGQRLRDRAAPRGRLAQHGHRHQRRHRDRRAGRRRGRHGRTSLTRSRTYRCCPIPSCFRWTKGRAT